ncbi:MAG: two-component sensor histidine kinase, partial [Clostridium paraputrificum]
MKNKDNFIKRLGKKIYNLRIFNPLRKYIDMLMVKIEKSIRFELMVVVGICFAVSFIFYGMANNAMRKEHTNSNIAYNYEQIEYSARNYVNSINNQEALKLDDNNYFINLFSNESGKAYITDLDGNVLQKSSNVVEDKIDIFSVLSSANSSEYDSYRPMERKVIYPLNISGQRCYFIYSNTPSAHIEEDTYIVSNSFLALILSCLVFIVIFIIVTNKKMKYLDEIASGLKIIANGDLNHHIEER